MRGSVALGVRKLGRFAYRDESHVWFRRDLHAVTGPVVPEGGWLVQRAGEEDVLLLDGLPGASVRLMSAYRTGGAHVWLVVDRRTPVFACLTFPLRAPVAAAPGGWLVLPPATVVLEDSLTHPAYRGRGIAPAAWEQIASVLAAEGVRHILTKVGEENASSRRAVGKAGFREIARMRRRRLGPVARVEVHPGHDDPLARHLAARLSRSASPRAPG